MKAAVQLGELSVFHEFVVVKTLVAPVILGIDFLHKHGLKLVFTHNPVIVSSNQKVEAPVEKSMAVAQVFPIYEATKSHISEVCATSIDQGQRLI